MATWLPAKAPARILARFSLPRRMPWALLAGASPGGWLIGAYGIAGFGQLAGRFAVLCAGLAMVGRR